jgi:hypothetical protein
MRAGIDNALGHPILRVLGGFLRGMLSMSIATRFYGMPYRLRRSRLSEQIFRLDK